MKHSFAVIISTLIATCALAADTVAPAVIPQPATMERFAGAFKLAPDTRIYSDPASLDTGNILAAQLRASTSGRFQIRGNATADLKVTDGILLTTAGADAGLGAEGYELTVST